MKKTVLITGCSSGFGRLAAETFHRNGWNVVATMRSPQRETELDKLDNVLVARLDVADVNSIRQAVQAGDERFGAIDVVVNNAGYGGHGLFEQVTDADVRAMFDTNVFGLMSVLRAVLPQMRRRGGVVINVTSMAGLMGIPGNSIYAASKHAAQGFSEALALELRPLGVRVHVIQPGAYPTTRFTTNLNGPGETGDAQLASHSERLRARFVELMESMATQGGEVADPQEVADKIFECATSEEAPVHNPVGADAHMLLDMMGAAAARQDFLDQIGQMLLPPSLGREASAQAITGSGE